MAQITASLVKDLREKTGAGMMDCKKALSETDGDIEAAVDWLRKSGLAAAAKKASRVAAEGLVAVSASGSLVRLSKLTPRLILFLETQSFRRLFRLSPGSHSIRAKIPMQF